MPQPSKPAHSGLLARWLPEPGPPPPYPQRKAAPARTNLSSLREGAKAVLNYQPLRNALMCNLARNFWIGVSQVSGTALNSPTEKTMMRRYFGGGGGSYRLSREEWKAAVDVYNRYGDNVLATARFATPDGGSRQNINFAGILGDDRLDGLLGSATGYFDKYRNLVGLRDSFDFDDAPRGRSDNPFLQAAYSIGGKAVGLVEKDANTFCPRGANPVTITGGRRR